MNMERKKKEKLAKPRCSSENWKTGRNGLCSNQNPEMFVALPFNARDGDQVPNGVQHYICFTPIR
jgi:hypothetical protein